MTFSDRGISKASSLSTGLCNASILLYTIWLLLPAAQTAAGAVGGAAAIALFGLGVALDTAYLRARWWDLALRVLCCAALPLVLWFCLHRGGENFAGYYVQNGMFWFPLLYCGYARFRGDERLWRYLKITLLACMAVTTLTTIGWLIEGMLREGRIYAYSRSLGSGESLEVYRKELMGRNIGGYDFIYASMLSLPLTCYAAIKHKGWKRGGFIAFCAAQLIMIVLSQYTYAIVFAAALMALEILGALARWIASRAFRKRLSVLRSLLWGAVPLLLLCFFRVPLVSWAAGLCQQIGFTSAGYSLEQLLRLLAGQAVEDATRLDYYQTAYYGFMQSPILGSLLGGESLLSQHSDLLDLLSALGLLGAGVFGLMVWCIGRTGLKGFTQSPAKDHLLLQYAALIAFACLGTITYSRDISLVLCMGALLTWELPPKPQSSFIRGLY